MPGLFAAALLAAGSPVRAEWLRAESDHFVVYGRSEKSVREYASMLEDFDSLLRSLHGRPKDEVTPRKLPVYLIGDFKQLKRVPPDADAMVDIRVRAVILAPQVGRLRLDAARALIQVKDVDLAGAVLTPLASNPHGGGEVEAPQALLTSIEAKAGDGDKAQAKPADLSQR